MKMKNHWGFKLLALILVAVSAATLAVSGFSVVVNTCYGLYHTDLETKIQELAADEIGGYVYEAAMAAAVEYVKETNTDPGSEERELWESYYNYTWHDRGIWPEYEYTVYSDGVEKSTTKENVEYAQTHTCSVDVENGAITNLGSDRKAFPTFDELPLNYEWVSYFGKELPGLDNRTVYYDLVCTDLGSVYRLEWFADSTFDVEIHLTEADMTALSDTVRSANLLKVAYACRQFDIPVVVISAVVLLGALLYLCFAAGKKPGTDEIRPRGTNCIPLDLFVIVAGLGITLCAVLGWESLKYTVYVSTMQATYLWIGDYALCAACMALCAALFLTALCAQVRLGNRAWLKRSIIGLCWSAIWGWCRKLWNWLCGYLGRGLRCVRELVGMMPLLWQWLVAYGVLLLVLWWSANERVGVVLFLAAIAGILLVVYSAYSFGKLRDAAKRMGQGDLDTKIDTRQDFLYGCFGEFAADLNVLGDTCITAAVERTKSERMKSELITNVSHDIKTPLTSIINYVDLLQRAENEEQRAEYLEVLDRQSQRLKKLIEDLMEMSKASSGNVNAELMQGDVVEAVNQALGEFGDRMNALNLNVIFRRSEESIPANFDGKLLWRVMSNVLGNVVKYALPGTRVYVDIVNAENKVYLSFKNISREPLNISADELMERFVRGDSSRNSEGNGLGLNIAKSLMEVQNGDLALTVDGDLFKVTLMLNEK